MCLRAQDGGAGRHCPPRWKHIESHTPMECGSPTNVNVGKGTHARQTIELMRARAEGCIPDRSVAGSAVHSVHGQPPYFRKGGSSHLVKGMSQNWPHRGILFVCTIVGRTGQGRRMRALSPIRSSRVPPSRFPRDQPLDNVCQSSHICLADTMILLLSVSLTGPYYRWILRSPQPLVAASLHGL